MKKNIVFVFAGGFVGANLRFLVGNIYNIFPSHFFPLPTIIVNVIGAFLLTLFTYSSLKNRISPGVYTMICTGIVGSFTTFSTLSKDISLFVSSGKILEAVVYVLLTYMTSYLAMMISLKIAKKCNLVLYMFML